MEGIIQSAYGINGFDSMDTMDDPLALGEGLFEEAGVDTLILGLDDYTLSLGPTGPLGYYLLDETSGTNIVDATGRFGDGTLTGSPALNQTALTDEGGGSFKFPGTGANFVTLPTGNIGKDGADFSLSFFMRRDAVVPRTWFVWKHVISAALREIEIGIDSSDALELRADAVGPALRDTVTTFADDMLYHIAAVYRSGVWELWVSAVEITTTGATAAGNQGTPNLIGSWRVGGASCDDFLDRLSFWDDYALTEAQVAEISGHQV